MPSVGYRMFLIGEGLRVKKEVLGERQLSQVYITTLHCLQIFLHISYVVTVLKGAIYYTDGVSLLLSEATIVDLPSHFICGGFNRLEN